MQLLNELMGMVVRHDSVPILQNDSMSISSIGTNISCYGLLDGSVQLDVFSGGLPI